MTKKKLINFLKKMQAESSKHNLPSIEFFLPDDDYDSDFNFLEYDLVEADDVIVDDKDDDVNEETEKVNDTIVDDKDDDVEDEDSDVIVEDEVYNKKKKRKRGKKILLQTDIDKLRSKLHLINILWKK